MKKQIFKTSAILIFFLLLVSSAASSMAQTNPDPVAAYHFNEGVGAVLTDVTGNNHHGSISGAAWSGTGKFGGALSFDGIDDLVSITDHDTLDFTSGMTLEAWVKPDSLSGWNTVILKESATGLAYSLYANDDAPRPAAYINTASTNDISAVGTGPIPLDTWTHLASTFDGSVIQLYVNGSLAGSRSVSDDIITSNNPLMIGGNIIWGEYFGGLIDEVRIYNRPLSQTEIAADMNAPIEPPPPDFSFEVLDNTKTVAPDGSTYFELEVAFLNGFVSNTGLDLWVTGLPANVTGNYAFDPMSHQGRTELIITASNATTGTYSLTMGATGEGITKSEDVTLIITNDVDFALAASPSSQTISAGNGTAFTLNLSETNDFVDPVSLSIPNLPTGFSASFSPANVVPAGDSTLTISTDEATPAGQYTLTVQGQSGSLIRTTDITVIVVQESQSWTVTTIGSTGVPNNTVRVGAIRTDSINRIYVGTIDTGRVLEYSWNGSGWDGPIDIGGSIVNQEIHNMNIGDGRGDGVERLYAASYDGNIYELWHDGTSWQQLIVYSLDGLGMHTAIGDGRNDGVTRLYSASTKSLYESTWNGTAWVSQRIGATPGSHGVAVGNGRDNGTNSVFAASIQNGTYEARFDNDTWTITHMGDSGDARDVEIGDGRNDGSNRVYVPLYDGRLREMTWNGSAWDILDVPSEGASLIHAYVIPGRNDGVNRVYASSSNGKSFEYTWNDKTYTTTNMGGGNDYMYGQHYGDVRGDGLIRIYSADRGQVNRVYEYTWGSGVLPPTVTQVSPQPGTSYDGIIPFEISSGGSGNIASVQFRLNGENIGPALTTPPFVMNWDPATAGGGYHQFTAVVTDNFANQVVSDPFNLMVFELENGDP